MTRQPTLDCGGLEESKRSESPQHLLQGGRLTTRLTPQKGLGTDFLTEGRTRWCSQYVLAVLRSWIRVLSFPLPSYSEPFRAWSSPVTTALGPLSGKTPVSHGVLIERGTLVISKGEGL